MNHYLELVRDFAAFRSRAAEALPVCRKPVARPTGHWTLMLIATLVLGAALLVSAALAYVLILSSADPAGAPLPSPGLNLDKLRAALERAESLAEEHEALSRAARAVVDPAR